MRDFHRHFMIAFGGVLAVAALAAVWAHEAPPTKICALTLEHETLELLQRTDSVLALSIASTATQRREFTLAARAQNTAVVKIAAPLKLSARQVLPGGGAQIALTFVLQDNAADAREVCVWLRQAAGGWVLCCEWSVERFKHEERGEKNETQTVAFAEDGAIKHSVKRENVEGIETTCGQACKCKIWQTRTVFSDEEELLEWNEASRKVAGRSFRKWYVAQPEENVLSIARKLGLENFTALYYLNPGLQRLDKLPDGCRLLVEKR